jgi:hypothetical protein
MSADFGYLLLTVIAPYDLHYRFNGPAIDWKPDLASELIRLNRFVAIFTARNCDKEWMP